MPIPRQDGNFFGTLCAIDPSPAILNTPEIVGIFKVYAKLVSFHLNAIEQLPAIAVQHLEDKTAAVLHAELETLAEFNLEVMSRDKRSKQFVAIIQQSSEKIKQLIEELTVAAQQYPVIE